jgi:transposase
MAAAAGLKRPLPEEYDDRQLNELPFPLHPDRSPPRRQAGVDYAAVHRELKTQRRLTLQLIWEKYRQNQPAGYGYSRFCELYQRWLRNYNVVMWQEHRPGEKMFVDWAGPDRAHLRS